MWKIEDIPTGPDLIVSYLLALSKSEIEGWLLPEIASVLNNLKEEGEVDTAPVWAEFNKTRTILRNAWNNDNAIVIPTKDFEGIIISWSQFLRRWL